MALKVEVVTPEKRIFSGEANMVQARTLSGDLGILPGHISLLGVLVDGEVVVKETNGQSTTFQIHGGFLSVNKDRVSILGESSE
ncbi:MAG: F0F1 ATP synthase subunit epsilon [Actinomycetota bacterium]